MKKLFVVFAFALVGVSAIADTYTYSTGVMSTNTAAIVSDDLPIAGYVERVEAWFSGGGGSTQTWTLATYGNDRAIQTVASGTVTQNGSFVVSPRVVGTGTSGTALAAVMANGAATTSSVLQQLTVPYEQIQVGGNLRLSTTLTAPGVVTNTLNVRVFFKK